CARRTRRCVSQAAEPGDQRENEAPALSTASQGGGLTHGDWRPAMTSLVDPIVGQPDGTQAIDVLDATAEAMPRVWHTRMLLIDIAAGAVHLDHSSDLATVHGKPATNTQDEEITHLLEGGYAERMPISGDLVLTPKGASLAAMWCGFKA